MSTYQNYEIKVESRDELWIFKTKKIGTMAVGGFSIAHFKKLGYSIKDFPKTEKLFRRLLLLPLNHMMHLDEIDHVSNEILKFFKM